MSLVSVTQTDDVHQADRWLNVGELLKRVSADRRDFSNRSVPSATLVFAKLNFWYKDTREFTTSDIGGRRCFEGCSIHTITEVFQFLIQFEL